MVQMIIGTIIGYICQQPLSAKFDMVNIHCLVWLSIASGDQAMSMVYDRGNLFIVFAICFTEWFQ